MTTTAILIAVIVGFALGHLDARVGDAMLRVAKRRKLAATALLPADLCVRAVEASARHASGAACPATGTAPVAVSCAAR